MAMEPERRPVAGSSLTPEGRWSAVNCSGLVPVTGIVKMMGWPGLTPKTFGPLIRGMGPGWGVKIIAESPDWAKDGIEEIRQRRKRGSTLIRMAIILPDKNSGKGDLFSGMPKLFTNWLMGL